MVEGEVLLEEPQLRNLDRRDTIEGRLKRPRLAFHLADIVPEGLDLDKLHGRDGIRQAGLAGDAVSPEKVGDDVVGLDVELIEIDGDVHLVGAGFRQFRGGDGHIEFFLAVDGDIQGHIAQAAGGFRVGLKGYFFNRCRLGFRLGRDPCD